MGFHLDLRRAQPGGARARARPRRRRLLAAGWRCVFLAWMFTPAVSDQLLRAEIGYAGATALLALILTVLYRRGTPPDSAGALTERAISR